MFGAQSRAGVRRWAVAGWLVSLLAVVVQGCGTPPPLVLVSPRARGTSDSVHLALGEPQDADPSDDVPLDHGVFVLSYNPMRRVANWVAWRLVAEDLGAAPRSNRFHPDDLLAAAMPGPRPQDYVGSHYDRGHLCPSADRSASSAANQETFVMTNMQPQRHALNAGPWQALEHFERDLASSDSQVFIVAGGLFDVDPRVLPGGEAVPRANFKIIVVLGRGQGPADVTPGTSSYAVIMPNSAAVAGTDWSEYLVAIDDVERQSGYDFLSRIPTETQAILEAARPR